MKKVKRPELVSKSRHQNKLLCNVKRNDSMDWCLELYFVFIFNIFFLFIFRQNPENMYMNYGWWIQQHEILSSIHIASFHSNLISIYIIYIHQYIYIYIHQKQDIYFLTSHNSVSSRHSKTQENNKKCKKYNSAN